MTHTTQYTVIGAGHGGKAMAAHLVLMGFPTTLYNRTPDRVSAISVRGMDAIIRLARILHRTDYWRRGHTLEKLGINKLSIAELTLYINEGVME